MLKIYYQLPNGKSFAHVSRSCTSTLCAIALQTFYKNKFKEWKNKPSRPQEYLEERWTRKLPSNCLVMVRDPVERLASYYSVKKQNWDCVYQIIKAQKTGGVIKREFSENISMRRYHHLAPLTLIADHDSHFILFPEVQKACDYLELEYNQQIHVSEQDPSYNKEVPENIQNLLKDDIIMYNFLAEK